MATGRFPARSASEVSDFSDKIIEFESNMKNGIWKQRVTLVADDPIRPEKESFELSIGKSHTHNSEKIAKMIPSFMEMKKIYLVKYDDFSEGSSLNVTKPSATKELIETINQGTSIINYIGHGNSRQWAQEKLLVIDENRNDINLINTEMKLPLWIAGTCNWGHFDKIDEESFAEELIRTSMDGASAVISTSRGISVSSNINFLEKIFPTVRKSVDFILSMQTDQGDIYWASQEGEKVLDDSLITGSSSIYKSLECAAQIYNLLNEENDHIKKSKDLLKDSLINQPERYDRTWETKARYSMDWYYPILCGVLDKEIALKRIDKKWDVFIVEGMGCKCVSEEPWVTVAAVSYTHLTLPTKRIV